MRSLYLPPPPAPPSRSHIAPQHVALLAAIDSLLKNELTLIEGSRRQTQLNKYA